MVLIDLLEVRLPTNLQFVKNAVFLKCNTIRYACTIIFKIILD